MTAGESPIANLSEDRLRLLRRLHEERRDADAAGRPGPEAVERIPRRRPSTPVPASHQQRGLWFLDQIMGPGDNWTYNVGCALRLGGGLDVGVLRECVAEIVRRHEVLRTVFAAPEGVPRQVVRDDGGVVVVVRDLSGVAEAQRAAVVEAAVGEEVRRPFDLERGPLFRVTLFRLSEREHVLVASFHHIVSDGWSAGVFFDELRVLYEALGSGAPSPLPELPLQYGDYAVWQQEFVQRDGYARQLDYWREQLGGAPALLELPTDFPRPPVPTYEGGEVTFALPAELTRRLRALGRAERATLFMVLLAAFQALLGRYSGQTDVCVGSPVAGRGRPELERLIGFFVNTLVLRGDLSGDPSFRELLRRTRATTLHAYENQDVTLERLVEELQPDRTLDHNPLFQVMFVLEDRTGGEPVLGDLEVAVDDVPGETAKFDLTLTALEGERQIEMVLEYSTQLFAEATVERFAAAVHRFLDAVAHDPDQPVGRVRLADAPAGCRARTAPARPAVTLPDLFEAQAQRRPAATAVVAGGAAMDYGEVDAAANRMAAELQARGVSRGDVVGLALPRSAGLVTAIIAVLKAGAAYLPLDTELPPERMRFMLADAEPACVVTTSALASGHLARTAVPLVVLDAAETARSLAARAGTAPARACSPEDLAYVMYTSGSTGQPKGVMVSHAQVVRLLSTTEGFFSFGPDDVWTLFHSTGFDFSVWELWGALAHGGRLVVVPASVARSPADFLQLIEDERVTVLNQTPSAFRELTAEALSSNRPETWLPRLVIFGGEALAPGDLERWFSRHGPRCPGFVNMYGITETTVHTTYRPVGESDVRRWTRSPIGTALPDLRLHVLDAYGEPVPVGLPGELYVGGPGLAWGYLGRPGLTAERFVPDPFSGLPGARLYRSGDLCRWRADDELEYLGRGDQQVKVRGYRIELGEIESALADHAGVREAVVLLREDAPGDPRLVAYIIPAGAQPPDGTALRAHLGRRLPSYMVPGAYVPLDAWPLTGNGKLDRQALPAPGSTRPELDTPFRAPRSTTEQMVADLMADVLGVDRVGGDDDFFALGGHSFSAVRLANRIDRVFDTALPPMAVFQAPTPGQLALRVDELRERGGRQTQTGTLVRLGGTGSGPPLYLVHPIGGNVLCYRDLGRRLGVDRPVVGVAARGLDGGPVHRSIEDMAADYVASIEASGQRGACVLGGWSMGGLVAYEMARQIFERTGREQPVLLLDTHPPVTGAGPVTGAELLAWFAQDWGRTAGVDLGMRAEDLAGAGPDEQLRRLLRRARETGVLTAEDEVATVRRLLEVFRANAGAMDAYRLAGHGHGRLLVLEAAGEARDGGCAAAWRDVADGRLAVRTVPGDHYGILRWPHVRDVADAIRSMLDEEGV